MKVCLVTAPIATDFEDPEDAASQEVREAAEEPQLGILTLAGVLEQTGTPPSILNLNPFSATRYQMEVRPLIYLYELKYGINAYLRDWAKGTAMRSMALSVAQRVHAHDAQAEAAARTIADEASRLYDAMHGLMCRHELESLDGIELVSRANQAAAFFRISRSSRSVRFSRRSRRTSSCSAVVRPSRRCPSSRSAWRTQFRMHWADGSNCRPSSSGVRPLRTSSTMRCRNSGGYGPRLFGIVDAPFRPNHGVSTKPGQLHFDLYSHLSLGRSLSSFEIQLPTVSSFLSAALGSAQNFLPSADPRTSSRTFPPAVARGWRSPYLEPSKSTV